MSLPLYSFNLRGQCLTGLIQGGTFAMTFPIRVYLGAVRGGATGSHACDPPKEREERQWCWWQRFTYHVYPVLELSTSGLVTTG